MKLIHKLILGFWTVILLSSITGYFAINYCKAVLEKSFIQSTESLAYEVLGGIEKNIYNRVELFRDYSLSTLVQKTVSSSNQDFEKINNIQAYINKTDKEWTSTSKKEISPFMQNLMNKMLSKELREKTAFFRKDYGYEVFGEVFVTNRYGANVAQTGKTSDYRQNDEVWWKSTERDGLYVGDVEYDESANIYSTDIGLKINDKNGNFIGVMKIVLNIKDIINFINEVKLLGIHKEHNTIRFKIITTDGKLIYSTEEGNNFLFLKDVSYLLPKVHLSNESVHQIVPSKGSRSKNERPVEILVSYAHSRGYKDFKGLDWILIVEQDAEELFAPVTALRNKILTVTLSVIIASMLVGFIISTYISKNFRKLRDAAGKIGRGDLDARIDIESNDEIGQLAKTFQKMTEDLKMTTVTSDRLTKEVTERKRVEAMVQVQLKRFNVLRFIDMTITASLDLKVTLNILTIQAITNLGIDAISVLLMNHKTQTLEHVASRGFRTTALKHTNLKLGNSYAGRAAQEQHIVNIPNLKEEPDAFKASKLFPKEDFISYFAVPLIAKGQVKGVLELFHRTPLDVKQDWLEFIENIANQAAIAIDNATLFKELVNAYDTTIEGWSRAMDLRDKETKGHTQRVTEMTVRIASELGIIDEDLVHIRRGALLHDMGKMGIPDSILFKPGKLTDEEWEIMKRHPEYAHDMLYPIEYLRSALDIPYYHHEKWDGTGYPRGLTGEDIPLAARIFAVVDVWDALISDRPYRSGWPEEKVLEHIRSLSGTHFDPKVVEMFFKMN
jgi:HD-GYP domain-containing protein (c-di-GMP phosphodiesterase class II)